MPIQAEPMAVGLQLPIIPQEVTEVEALVAVTWVEIQLLLREGAVVDGVSTF